MQLVNVHVHALGDCLTSRPKGCSQPRELWFVDIFMYMYIHVPVHVHVGQLLYMYMHMYNIIIHVY